MLGYYFELALRSFRNSRALTLLMVLTIAIGVGASMTTLTVYHVLSGDPIPGKSDKLFVPQLAPESMAGYEPSDEPNDQFTRFDAETLLREKRADRQVMMSGGGVIITPDKERPRIVTSRYSTADFFAMFEAPFRFGTGWSAADDTAQARVVVLSAALNETLFGGTDSRGKTVTIREKEFTVIGVLKPWRPVPHFYDLTQGAFAESADIYLPFHTAIELQLGIRGSMNCWSSFEPSTIRGLATSCTWIQYWVELDTPAKARDYLAYLKQYSDGQRASGRFERPTNVRLRSVMEWLRFRQVVPSDITLQVWLAFGFLLVCLANTVGLLLAKCMRRAGEVGVRRALGAPRKAIFMQFLVEAGSLGLVGGLLGLGLTGLGLWAVRAGAFDYSGAIALDAAMLFATFGLALLSSVIAGLLPAWRACQVTPALQLKSQ
jgi:putative ABC transport system permease protein